MDPQQLAAKLAAGQSLSLPERIFLAQLQAAHGAQVQPPPRGLLDIVQGALQHPTLQAPVGQTATIGIRG